jgi:hypothetical protein
VSRIKHVSVLKSLKSLFKDISKNLSLTWFFTSFVCNGAFFFRMVSFFLCTLLCLCGFPGSFLFLFVLTYNFILCRFTILTKRIRREQWLHFIYNCDYAWGWPPWGAETCCVSWCSKERTQNIALRTVGLFDSANSIAGQKIHHVEMPRNVITVLKMDHHWLQVILLQRIISIMPYNGGIR